ncbi:hypothetical protein JZ751_024110 [Albula glossodonta]|uniref:Uncharacterized protein n=1 Tax=Albula glossodonta TaxID=121402 RepID=A0A8T2NJE3_9TELE|nr:hypothetical protein JZ751_024110 [Albula glossodonta]
MSSPKLYLPELLSEAMRGICKEEDYAFLDKVDDTKCEVVDDGQEEEEWKERREERIRRRQEREQKEAERQRQLEEIKKNFQRKMLEKEMGLSQGAGCKKIECDGTN